MRRILLTIICMALWTTVASAKDIYIAQNTAGANTGSDCADAHSAAWFNSSGNWGSGSTQIGPGTVVHLCGNFTGAVNTTMLTTQGHGAAGNPVTILFEPGAVLQSPAWASTGAINVPDNYITIDGGTNGIIENTLDGTSGGACLGGACSVQQAATVGLVVNGTNGIAKNLTVTHICMHTFLVNDGYFFNQCSGIQMNGANGLTTQNTIDNANTGIGGGNGAEISYNTITFCNHSISIGIASGATWTGIKIHNNDISQAYTWDDGKGSAYHHNGIMLFAVPPSGGTFSAPQIYYNYMHGRWSEDTLFKDSHITSTIFLDANSYLNSMLDVLIVRNVLELDTTSPYNYPTNGYLGGGGCTTSSGCLANNTIIANNTIVGSGRCWSIGDYLHSPVVFNNLCATTSGGDVSLSSANYPSFKIDYNIYAGTGRVNAFTVFGGNINDYAHWSASPYFLDVHGSNPTLAAAKLDATFHLLTGSVANGAAKNLTASYCGTVPVLCTGAPSTFGKGGANDGVTASVSGAWDDGAYPSGSPSAVQPSAPTGLFAVVN